MSGNKHWVLPQGIEEALPETAARLEALRRDLLDYYASCGYELVMPPFIDYIESLLTGTGHDLDLQTFKLIDQVSGRTLGIRADMTPQVARIDAHQLNRDEPTRLCYMGTVLHARPDSFGSSRSPLQVGAELYGHAGIESDAEILGLMFKTFEIAGVNNIHIDLGNVDIYKGLSQQAGLSPEDEAALFKMLQGKEIPGIEQLLDSIKMKDSDKVMFLNLAELNGDASVIDKARTMYKSASDSVHKAIDYLQQTASLLSTRYTNIKLNFDLAELHGYHYQTGVVFAAFVPELGEAIARGGRYDDIGQIFGRSRAATGFSTDLKLLDSLSSRECKKPIRIFAPCVDDEKLRVMIDDLRDNKKCVIEQLPNQSGEAAAMGCSKELKLVKGEWQVVDI